MDKDLIKRTLDDVVSRMFRYLPVITLRAYEIKAGMTFRQDYFTQLIYLKDVLGDKLTTTQVIYDGSQENAQSNNGIVNFRSI